MINVYAKPLGNTVVPGKLKGFNGTSLLVGNKLHAKVTVGLHLRVSPFSSISRSSSIIVLMALSEGDADNATSMNKRGLTFLQAADHEAAVECFKAAIGMVTTRANSSTEESGTLTVDGGIGAENSNSSSSCVMTLAVSHSHLSAALRALGNLEASLQHANIALTIRQKRSPQAHLTAESFSATATILRLLGRLEDARKHAEQAILIEEKISKRSLVVARFANELGLVLHAEERLDEAQAAYLKSLDLRRGHVVADDLCVARILNNLAMIDLAKGSLRDAESRMKNAVELHQRLAPDGHEFATLLNNLAALQESQGKLGEALDKFRQCLELRQQQRRQGKKADKQADVMASIAVGHSNIGLVLQRQGHLAEALVEFRSSLDAAEKVAPNGLSAAAAHRHIGDVLHAQGQLTAAACEYRAALVIEETAAPSSLEVCATYNNLGSVQRALGNADQAVFLFKCALAIQSAVVPNGMDISSTHHNLGQALLASGNLDEAMLHLTTSLNIRERHCAGPSARMRSVAASQLAVGIVCMLQGRLKDAEKYLISARAVEEQTSPILYSSSSAHASEVRRGDGMEETLLGHLGVLYAHLGNVDRSVDFLKQARSLSNAASQSRAELYFTVKSKIARDQQFVSYEGDLEASGQCLCISAAWIDDDDRRVDEPPARDFAIAQRCVLDLQLLMQLTWLLPPDDRNVLRALHVHEMPVMIAGRVVRDVPRYFFFDRWDTTLERGSVGLSGLERLAIDVARGLAALHRQGLVCHQVLSARDIVLGRGGYWMVSPAPIPGASTGTASHIHVPQDIVHPSARADAWRYAMVLLGVIDSSTGSCWSRRVAEGHIPSELELALPTGDHRQLSVVASCVVQVLRLRGNVAMQAIAQRLQTPKDDRIGHQVEC